MAISSHSSDFAAIGALAAFDQQSGNWLERLLFNPRRWVVIL